MRGWGIEHEHWRKFAFENGTFNLGYLLAGPLAFLRMKGCDLKKTFSMVWIIHYSFSFGLKWVYLLIIIIFVRGVYENEIAAPLRSMVDVNTGR